MCCCYFILGIICCIFMYSLSHIRENWMGHGKCLTQKNTKTNESSYFLLKILNKHVPKAWFLHFYLLGLILNTTILLYLNTPNMIALLLEIHFVRRLLECIYVTIYRQSSYMLLIHYILGLSYYVIVEISVYCLDIKLAESFYFMNVLGILLFLISSLCQYRFHLDLRNLRINSKTSTPIFSSNDHFPYPKFFPWNKIYCPHYTAEISIYISLCCVSGFDLVFILNSAFVATNLSISAIETKKWSISNLEIYEFLDSNTITHERKWCIIPFII